jgi:hypothetical protein
MNRSTPTPYTLAAPEQSKVWQHFMKVYPKQTESGLLKPNQTQSNRKVKNSDRAPPPPVKIIKSQPVNCNFQLTQAAAMLCALSFEANFVWKTDVNRSIF